MKAKLLVVSLSLIIAAACSKDKFKSTPTLTFESVNGSTFFPGQTVTFKLRLTDKEGDFLDSTDETTGEALYKKAYLFYERVTYVCPDQLSDTSAQLYVVPSFPTNKYLDVRLDINYTSAISGQYPTLNGCVSGTGGIDDSTYLRIWIKDEAGNVSDTVNTPVIKLIKN